MSGARLGPLSQSEMIFYLTRAMAGAGVPYGVAEPCARAVAEMAAAGRDLTPELAEALQMLDQGQSSITVVLAADSRLTGRDGRRMSALYAALALTDLRQLGQSGITAGAMDQPALGGALIRHLSGSRAKHVDPMDIHVDAAAWSVIDGFFRRCLVPNSDASRLSGAGAGLNDTD